jgi:hypothetical protein
VKRRDRFVAMLERFVTYDGTRTPDGFERKLSYQPSRGETVLMGALADYLKATPECDFGENWLAYLPKRVAAAFEHFRCSREHISTRAVYLAQTGSPIPSLINAHEGHLHRTLVVHSVVRLLPIIAAQSIDEGERMPWLETALDSYLRAQDNAIAQAWHGFVDRHYVPLLRRIKDESHRGNSGTFGETELLTWAGMGRVMFQFQRGGADESISAVADDGDPVGYRSGLNATHIPYERAVAMIRDVTAHFDDAKLLKNTDVSFGGF